MAARSKLARTAVAAGLFAVYIGADFLLYALIKNLLAAVNSSGAPRSGALSAGYDILAYAGARLGTMLGIAVLSMRMSYPVRDNMYLGLVPLLGETVLARLCWRVTGYSQREDFLSEDMDPAMRTTLTQIMRVPGVVRCRPSPSGALDVVLDPWNEAFASEIRWLAIPFDVRFVAIDPGDNAPGSEAADR